MAQLKRLRRRSSQWVPGGILKTTWITRSAEGSATCFTQSLPSRSSVRPNALRSRNWPKSKFIGRSRTDGVFSVSSFSLSFFSFDFSLTFTFLFLFLVLTHLSLFNLFLFCFCFCPQKPELNPKHRTLHPKLSAGQPSAGQPSAGQPSAGQPSAGQPKISLFFFPSPATVFKNSSLPLLGVPSLNFGGV